MPLLFFVSFSLISVRLSAQVITRLEVSSMSGYNSIIQDWKQDLSIGYTENEEGAECSFILFQADSLILKVATLPVGCRVTDFKIIRDSVFFCGVAGSTNMGIVGCADINVLFSLYTNVHIGVLPPIISPTSTASYVTCPRHMDVFDYNGETHIIFVGEMVSSVSTVTTTLGEAIWNSVLGWTSTLYDNISGDMIYSDVAAGGNYVTVTAKSNTSENYYVLVFKKSNNTLYTPLNSGSIFEMQGDAPVGDIMVTYLESNEFALAYHYVDEEHNETGVDVQSFKVQPISLSITVNRWLKTPLGGVSYYTPSWKMTQLSYDSQHQLLWLLHYAANVAVPSLESSLFIYDMTNISVSYVNAEYTPGVVMEMMDVVSAGGCWTIGRELGVLQLSKEVIGAVGTCRSGYTLPYGVGIGSSVVTPYVNNFLGPFISDIAIYPTISYPEIEVQCAE